MRELNDWEQMAMWKLMAYVRTGDGVGTDDFAVFIPIFSYS